MQKQAAPFGEAQYENPDKPDDFAQLFVCQPAVVLVKEALDKSFGKDEAINLESLAQVVGNYSQESFKKMVTANKGKFKINLDGKEIVLKHKTHFYFNLKEQGKGMAS